MASKRAVHVEARDDIYGEKRCAAQSAVGNPSLVEQTFESVASLVSEV